MGVFRGKIEAGEGAQETLVREIKEELDVVIEIKEFLGTVEYSPLQGMFHLYYKRRRFDFKRTWSSKMVNERKS